MRMQVGRVLAAVAVVGAAVAGCAGPGQAGSAVIVGENVVALERVQSRLDAVLARTELVAQVTQQGGGPPDIARDIVTREVLHDLLGRQGAAAGVAIPDADVDAAIAERGGADALLQTTFSDLPGLRDRVRDELLAAELARRSVGGLSVTADLVAATSREEAERTAEIVAAGGPPADELFAGSPQTAARDMVYEAAANPEVAGTVLFGTPVGGTVLFQPDPQQAGWIVFRVTDRVTDAVADPATVAAISQEQLVAIGERMMQPVGEDVGVRVNPRYGVWDPIRLRVVPEDQTAGRVLPPAG